MKYFVGQVNCHENCFLRCHILSFCSIDYSVVDLACVCVCVGLGKGIIGVVTRPVGGVVDFASSSFDGIRRFGFVHFLNMLRRFMLINERKIL